MGRAGNKQGQGPKEYKFIHFRGKAGVKERGCDVERKKLQPARANIKAWRRG